MKFSGKPLPNTCEAPEGREACVGCNLSISISFMHAEFLFAICKMGKQNCTLRACSQAQMKSCAMLGSEGFKQHLVVPSCTECDEKNPQRGRMSRASGSCGKEEGPRWFSLTTGVLGGKHRAASSWAWLACPSMPRQGKWLGTCPWATGVAGHSWAHSASLGWAGSTHGARGKWWGQSMRLPDVL